MHGLEGIKLGRYRLQSRLGHGGMSEVYLAYDELMHRDVAIKVVSSSHVDYIERFRREAEAIGNLHHNHILPAFDYGEQVPWHYLVMPYIDHESLGERLERGPLTLEDAGEMLSQIASGLQYAHEHGIVHRDIKPSNILLRDDHHAYLADFGLAKAVDGTGNVTQTGVLLGTPEFMAPELADGPASKSSDIYALGILLYQMVTGQLPFTGATALTVYLKQMHEQPIPPSRLNPAIPHELEQVILCALDKDPRRRFQTPNDLAQAYLQALNAPGTVSSWTRTPLVKVVLSDSGELPPLYDLTSETNDELVRVRGTSYASEEPHFNDKRVPQAEMAFVTASPVVAEEEKLVLPGSSLHVDADIPISVEQTIIQQPIKPATPVYTRRPAVLGSAHPGRDSFVVTSYLGISFLLMIMSVILFAVFTYSRDTHVENTSTAAARVSKATQTPRISVTKINGSPTPKVSVTMLTSNQEAVTTTSVITSSSPLLVDNLSANNNSWYENSACVFMNGTYHVIVRQVNLLVPCESTSLSFDNAAFQVDVSLLSGNDAGLIFRANDQQYYDFEITSQGKFFFRRHDSNASGGTYTYLIQDTRSNAIAPGNQKNTLLVIANGSDFKLFINNVFVGKQQDSTYTSGQVGFVIGTLPSETSGEASFAHFKVYTVSS
jgi:serine/threonine protein kinase